MDLTFTESHLQNHKFKIVIFLKNLLSSNFAKLNKEIQKKTLSKWLIFQQRTLRKDNVKILSVLP